MLSLSFSAAMLGIEGYVVRVEADSAAGTPAFAIIGLPDRALGEARERVRAAILNSGFAYPAGRLLVNLSPADVRNAARVYYFGRTGFGRQASARQRHSSDGVGRAQRGFHEVDRSGV
jgi:hypothetical protein